MEALVRLDCQRCHQPGLEENREVYGAYKVWLNLDLQGLMVARCAVERLVCELGLARVRRGRKVRTTIWTRLILDALQMTLCGGGRLARSTT